MQRYHTHGARSARTESGPYFNELAHMAASWSPRLGPEGACPLHPRTVSNCGSIYCALRSLTFTCWRMRSLPVASTMPNVKRSPSSRHSISTKP